MADPKGWRIPHSALIAAGFDPSWTADEKPPEAPVSDAEHLVREQPAERARALEDRCRRLESENMILRSHVERWQSVASERLDALNDLRVAFRTLPMTAPRQIEPAPEPKPEPKPRGWWSRMWD